MSSSENPDCERMAQSRSTRRSLWRAFGKDKKGLSAVEFAFVAGPFFLLMVGIFEICVLFVVSTVLEYGAREAARELRTGSFQSDSSATLEDFRTTICNDMSNLFACNVRLSVDVSKVTSFPTTADAIPRDADGNLDKSGFALDTTGREDIVVVTMYYEWQLITPMIGNSMANAPNNTRILVSSQVFRNEPF